MGAHFQNAWGGGTESFGDQMQLFQSNLSTHPFPPETGEGFFLFFTVLSLGAASGNLDSFDKPG